MTASLPGIGGSLVPASFLAAGLAPGGPLLQPTPAIAARLRRWWTGVERDCGPASGLRLLFDAVAAPLVASLGFRVADATFDRAAVRAMLATPRGVRVGLLVLPWTGRPARAWRDAAATAAWAGADWCLVISPPFASLVDARGHAVRRSLETAFPDALRDGSVSVLWTVLRAAAFEPAGAAAGSAATPVDALVDAGRRFHDAVRRDLQRGVFDALAALVPVLPRAPGGRGAEPAGPLDEALTIVYRALFLLFAESRDLVPRHHPVYRQAYTIAALCRDAMDADTAAGIWDGLGAITRLSRAGCRTGDLIVRPFNGRLFARRAAPALERRTPVRRARAAAVRDAALARALVALATRPGRAGRETISFADLGVEQLGAVYERVLDLEGHAGPGSGRPRRSRHGSSRRRSGTFYTPQPLCDFVVRRTLAPLVDGAPADGILALRVVDPAMGSGAFLVSACRYLADAYERALIAEGRWAPADTGPEERAGLRRLVAERCLAGVDLNPVAVQLARLSLWLATLAHGKPLGFLDHRLRAGDSLIGAWPENLAHVPTGRRPAGPLPLLDEAGLEGSLAGMAGALARLAATADDTVDAVRAKEALWARLAGDRSPVARWRLAADVWCARWFAAAGRQPAPAEVRAAIAAVLRRDRTLPAAALGAILDVARAAAASRRFFHWPLEFADVFHTAGGRPRDRPGFDAVIGNPPWEMLRRDDGGETRPGDLVRFIRESGLYPSCGRGHVNLYQPFVDRALALARPGGRVGLVLPWGLASDDGAGALRARLLDRTAVDTIVGLDNGAALFPIHRGLRFLVVTASPGAPTRAARARFGVRTPAELDALPAGGGDPGAYPVLLTPARLEAAGGATRRIPDARRAADLMLAEDLARRWPALGASEGWGARFGRELNATDDRPSFGAQGLPVIEGKHLEPFSVDATRPAARIDPAVAGRLLPGRPFDRPRLAYRDVSGHANRVSLIAAIVSAGVVTSHTVFCLRDPLPIERQHFLCALFNSFVLNAVVRLLMGGHVTTSLVEGLPAPPWRGTAAERRIARLAARLARRPDSAGVAAALQAAVARLYGVDAGTLERILEGFPLVPAAERTRVLGAMSRVSAPRRIQR